MATILIDQHQVQIKEIKQSDLDSLQRRLEEQSNQSKSEIAHTKKLLAMAEASRLEAQTDYQQLRIKYQQLNQEKELLEHLLIEKNNLIQSEMIVWINSKTILRYYEGKWRDRMGLKLSHEGLINGFVYAND